MSIMPSAVVPKRKSKTSEKRMELDDLLEKDTSENRLTWAILGGEQSIVEEPVSALDYVMLSQKGLQKKALAALAAVMSIPMKDMAHLLNISYKTLGRKRNDDTMDPLSSSLVIEMAQVVARGLAVFGDQHRLRSWLQRSNQALKGQRPLDLMNNPTGLRLVSSVLIRLEEGIHS
jgi:putative toxin-antitoxin system antitoxin component (TIGR02293 family)